jgi:hypothetical protein
MFGIGFAELIILFIILGVPLAIVLFLVLRPKRAIINPGTSASYCPKCGKEIGAGSAFCPYCGENLSARGSEAQPYAPASGITMEEFSAFIGTNQEKYLPRFHQFREGGEGFKATWHWPAFFVPFFWMLYRKLYGWAVLAFITVIIPYVGCLAHIVWGLTGYYIYYGNARTEILRIKNTQTTPETRTAVIAMTGGTGRAGLFIATAIGIVLLMGILAAIAIPAFVGYRTKAYNNMAQAELKEACNAAQSYFAENPDRTASLGGLIVKGYSPDPKIEMEVLNGSREGLSIRAKHRDSKNAFLADRNCYVSDENVPAPAM